MDYFINNSSNTHSLIETEKNEIKERLLAEYIALRKSKKLSQEDIAFLTGIARPNISRIENGKFDPTLEVLTKLASALDMKLEIRFVEKIS
ncbi:MAG: helix-turn-helix transcriptional regulator [Lachnospiraceae bacterium]|nr:helix-turn-helix transcriptional regulator [Lachnospiraceae bacterium]